MANVTCDARQKVSSAPCPAAKPTTGSYRKDAGRATQKLLGAWRLLAFTQNGQPHPVYGPEPIGTIRYDGRGNTAVQIMPDPSRHPCGAAGPMQGASGAIPGYIAYFGGYEVDERAKTVAHDRAGNVTPGEARTVVRHYEFLSEDRLALTLKRIPRRRSCGSASADLLYPE